MRLPHLTLAVRNLLRRPGFALTAIVLLALAAGANAAVFSVVRGVLLRPLPYGDPAELVALWPNAFVNNEDLTYWRERTRSFESIGAVSPGWMMALLADGLEPLKVTGARTSDNFFTTLGVSAALGRPLLPGDALPGRTGVAVLSFAVTALIAETLGRPRLHGCTQLRRVACRTDHKCHREHERLGQRAINFRGRGLLSLLLSVFAAVGLTLAVVGVYGVVVYRVRQREREFGIRLALGGAPLRIARSVVGQGAGYAAAGLLVGLPAALALARLMQSVVFGITTHDPWTFTALPAAIVGATLAACVLPARRAARLDPVKTMRAE